mgnify:CR=1 FL=1
MARWPEPALVHVAAAASAAARASRSNRCFSAFFFYDPFDFQLLAFFVHVGLLHDVSIDIEKALW